MMTRLRTLSTAGAALAALVLVAFGASAQATRFTVRVQNVSSGSPMALPDGSAVAAIIHPGAWFAYQTPTREASLGILYLAKSPFFSEPRSVYGIHYPAEGGLLFTPGRTDRGEGLKQLVHDGDPLVLSSALANRPGMVASGTFGPNTLTSSYEFTFSAEPGAVLTFAFKLGDAGDLFYSPRDGAIALFDGKRPIAGDVTPRVALWEGAFTDPTGPAHRPAIHRLDDATSFPGANGRVIRVVVEPVTVVSAR